MSFRRRISYYSHSRKGQENERSGIPIYPTKSFKKKLFEDAAGRESVDKAQVRVLKKKVGELGEE